MQEVVYDEKLNAVRTSIRVPFWTADSVLGWNFKAIGLGFNMNIINTCIDKKADLIVFIGHNHTTYFITYQRLKEFLDTFETKYRTGKGKVEVRVIAWNWFAQYKEEDKIIGGK